MTKRISLTRRAIALATVATWAAGLFAPATFAQAEKRVIIDAVSFEPSTQTLTINADILDATGEPVTKVEQGDLEFLLNGKPIQAAAVEIQTAKEAREPVAVAILVSSTRNYNAVNEKERSPFMYAKEGAIRFIQELSGNDKVAVFRYREGLVHDPIYPWNSNFTQAKETVDQTQPYTGADAEGEALTDKKGASAPSITPDFLGALDKALNNIATNAETLAGARRKFLVIMSDGKSREASDKQVGKLDAILERYAEHEIRIFSIGYAPDSADSLKLLQAAASKTKGIYKSVGAGGDLGVLTGMWDAFARRIKRQFILKVKLAELPDHGDPIKGKDLLKYNLVLKAKLKDGTTDDGEFQDVRMPPPPMPWKTWLKWGGIALGGILGLVLLIVFFVWIARRKPAPAAVAEGGGGGGKPDGPHRGRLTCIAGPMAGNEFYLVDDVTTIGRIKGNTIVLPDASVSSRHAALKIDQMRYEIADLSSQNKVLVNGQLVHKVFLKDGDRIKFGDSELQFWLK